GAGADQGRFAAGVRADERGDAAAGDVQREVVRHDDVLVSGADAVDGEPGGDLPVATGRAAHVTPGHAVARAAGRRRVREDVAGDAEEPGEQLRRQDLRRGAIADDAAVTHGDDPVADARGLVDVVQHHDDGAAFLAIQAIDQLHYLELVGDVEE